jgi:hypothetical protein
VPFPSQRGAEIYLVAAGQRWIFGKTQEKRRRFKFLAHVGRSAF